MMMGQLTLSSKRIVPDVLLAVACGVGLAWGGSLFAAGMLAGILLAASTLWPAGLTMLALGSVAVSLQYLFPFSYSGLELDAVQKLFILATVLLYATVRGIRIRMLLPAFAYMVVLFLTYTLSSRPPQLTTLVIFRAFLAAVVPWIVLSVRWDRRFAERSLIVMSFLPLASVLTGLALQVLGLYQVVSGDYLGSQRLEGANIPAHLALLGVIGIAAALSEQVQRRPVLRWLALLNFAIVLATLTRAAVAASIVIFAFWLWQEVGSRVRRHKRVAHVIIFMIVGGLAVYAFLPGLIYRTVSNPNQPGFNTSGRNVAWVFFFDQASINPWFGRGLGSTPMENQGRIMQSIPHNEYLHIFGDAGLVGGTMVLISIIVACRYALRRIDPSSRRLALGFLVATALLSVVDNTFSTVQFVVPFAWLLGSLASGDSSYVVSPSKAKSPPLTRLASFSSS
jgi:O-antigen ligase